MQDSYSDTHPKIVLLQRKLLQEASPKKKMALLVQMNQTVIILALAGLKSRFPDDSPTRITRRLADLLLGSELAEKVYGPFE